MTLALIARVIPQSPTLKTLPLQNNTPTKTVDRTRVTSKTNGTYFIDKENVDPNRQQSPPKKRGRFEEKKIAHTPLVQTPPEQIQQQPPATSPTPHRLPITFKIKSSRKLGAAAAQALFHVSDADSKVQSLQRQHFKSNTERLPFGELKSPIEMKWQNKPPAKGGLATTPAASAAAAAAASYAEPVHYQGKYGIHDYVGGWLNGKPHGKGLLTTPKGTTYEGDFVEGAFTGTGTLKSQKGVVCVGQFLNGKVHGQATLTTATTTYTGAYRNDQRHGFGILKFNGGTYTGYWENNKKSGQGELIRDDGSKATGSWENNQLHGKATSIDAEGNSYEGDWENGLQHGFGKGTWDNGKTTYVGMWAQNTFHGKGILNMADGTNWEGNFVEGKRHGKGFSKIDDRIAEVEYNMDVLVTKASDEVKTDEAKADDAKTLSQGRRPQELNIETLPESPKTEMLNTVFDGHEYVGEGKNGIPNGMGKLTTPANDVYTGEFVEGIIVKGSLKYANGDLYEGCFENWEPSDEHGKLIYAGTLDIYTGPFKSGQPNGKGRMKYAIGKILTCTFVNGIPQNPVVLELSNGTYHGPILNGKPEGIGRMVFHSENTYEGGFSKGKYHGKGTLVTDKFTYSGDFVHGQKEGTGKFTYNRGDETQIEFKSALHGSVPISYEGGISNGKYQGKGKLVKDNWTYTGDFVAGLREGIGEMDYRNGDKLTGEFHKGKMHGEVRIYYSNGSFFEGEYREGKKHGDGTLTFFDGSVLKAEWVDGEEPRRGTIKYPNGDEYEGAILDCQPHGEGLYTYNKDGRVVSGEWRSGDEPRRASIEFANGDKYEGEISSGLPDGTGTLTCDDGTVKEGEFNNGEFVEPEDIEQTPPKSP